MFKLRSPIPKKYMNNGITCLLTQLYGENKNRLFYGPKGHQGIDYRTIGRFKWLRDNTLLEGFRREERTVSEQKGNIPIIAAHGGYLTTNIYYRAKSLGWGMFITYKVDDFTEYRTLYWHIERPWGKLGAFFRMVPTIFKPRVVRPGAVIAIGGNSGYPRSSTGPHLHFELQKREKYNGVWGDWKTEDPMPYFQDNDIVYQLNRGAYNKWFYKGEEVTTLKAKEIIKSI